MTKREIGFLFAIIVLTILLITSVILGVTGYFSSATYLISNSELKVGDNISVGVRENQTSVLSLTFDGSYLPGETIPQIIQINSEDMNSNLKVRVKAEVFGSSSNFDFVTTSHFEKAEDGYYYYDETLQGGNKITFCNYITNPEEGDLISNEKYILTIVVETLDSDYAETIWKSA